MNEHTDSDQQGELAALRQRLDNLEAEPRELQCRSSRSRRPVVSRKLLLSVLPVALLLAAGGVLYAVDALFVDKSGNVGIGTLTPSKKLDVAGDAKVSGTLALRDMFAVAGPEQLRILRGTIRADGSIMAGIGFKVKHPGTGLFDIEFDKPFQGVPSISVTPMTLRTLDNAVISVLEPGKIEVKTAAGDEKGNPADRGFTFVILGK